MSRKLLGLLLLLLAPACGDDSESGSSGGSPGGSSTGGSGGGSGAPPSCALGIRLSGDVQATLSPDEETSCVAVDSFTSDIDVIYLVLGAVANITVRIGDVTEGQVGGPYPAGVNIVLADDRRYLTSLTACSVNIDEHRSTGTEGDGRRYQVSGTGTCSDALPDGGGSGAIAIADLAFRIPALWRDP